MVNAVRVHTEGIGGDSHIQPTPLDDKAIAIGPRRVTPLVTSCSERPEVQVMLEDQLRSSVARESDGIYLWLLEHDWVTQSSGEAAIIAALEESSVGRPYGEVVSSGLERNALNRLIGLGVVGMLRMFLEWMSDTQRNQPTLARLFSPDSWTGSVNRWPMTVYSSLSWSSNESVQQ